MCGSSTLHSYRVCPAAGCFRKLETFTVTTGIPPSVVVEGILYVRQGGMGELNKRQARRTGEKQGLRTFPARKQLSWFWKEKITAVGLPRCLSHGLAASSLAREPFALVCVFTLLLPCVVDSVHEDGAATTLYNPRESVHETVRVLPRLFFK